ncbi:TnsD family Tn7-like transposition protein [Clostridium ihumii]|uniref:TnsD family Tn7-like transposition protein n=1 Tax=Clostridium ihumii TaxID=1470356 RepID=UPI003D350891
MIDFFTDPYKDELIYSAIARYHFYSGNLDFKDTIEECFGKRTMVPMLELGGRLEYLAKELKGKYSAEKIINDNTVFSYYSPFIDKKRKSEIMNYMKLKGSSSIYTKLGMVAGGICKKNYIAYCPICSKQDIEENGESYIHREHQLQGIILCPHHGCKLKSYDKSRLDSSKIEYIRLERELLSLEVNNEKISNYEKYLRLAKDSYYLFEKDLDKENKVSISNRYKCLLYQKGLARATGSIKQKELYDEFINYYGTEFLRELESNIDFNNEYNWLKVITRNSKRSTHPIRHLLLIGFLCEDIEDFFKVNSVYTNFKIPIKKYNIKDADFEKMNRYKINIINFINANREFKRTEVRQMFKKEYTYLYRYDKKWLFENLPKSIKNKIRNESKIDWKQRDDYYLSLLVDRYNELMSLDNPINITVTSLAKPLGILVNIQKKKDKLPKTNNFLEDVCESTKEFQVRRCKKIIDKLIENNNEIKLWKVQRNAAIRSNQFNDIKDELIKYINEKHRG